MDSPLSDIDNNEVIADSEDEEGHTGARDKALNASSSNLGMLQAASTSSDGAPFEINYFAGFNDSMFSPAVSTIAERAKTRQRKPKERPKNDVLELTDDDDLILKPPPSKAKEAKLKEKPNKAPAVSNQAISSSTSTSTPPTVDFTNLPLINARNKIRPRPIKKPSVLPQSPQHKETSQATIPVPTSPLRPPPNPLADSSSCFNLPPSGPPLTSSVSPGKKTHLPPIEFLRSPDSTPLPSSLPEENIDELQILDRHDQANDNSNAILLPPPPTFFAGSSSLPNRPTAPTPKPPPPLPPVDVVDLTDIPNTVIVPSIGTADPSTSTKAKKPRKPRKKKGGAEVNEAASANLPQAPSRKKKGKVNKVTVEVLLPLPPQESEPAPVAKKRKTKPIQDNPIEEDELNIGVGKPGPSVETPGQAPSSPLESGNQQVPEDLNLFEDSIENPPKADKRKSKKRKGVEDPDVAPATRKRKNPPRSVEEQEDFSAAGSTAASKKPSRKAKKLNEDLDADGTAKATQAAKAIKGKRRMVFSSDDEDNGDNAAPVVVDPPAPSPDPEDNPKGKRKAPSEDDATRAADHREDDRNGLKTQTTGSRSGSSPDHNTTMVTQKRYETPSVGKYPSLPSRYTIAPKSQTSGMSELIRRVSLQTSSPFAAPGGRGSPRSDGIVYSPYGKNSRRALSRIAPLHPNRKTPPPPPPPPPPKKKSKKEIELEEKWEEEIIEEIGGVTEWLNLTESEKKDLKRMKRDREMGYCED